MTSENSVTQNAEDRERTFRSRQILVAGISVAMLVLAVFVGGVAAGPSGMAVGAVGTSLLSLAVVFRLIQQTHGDLIKKPTSTNLAEASIDTGEVSRAARTVPPAEPPSASLSLPSPLPPFPSHREAGHFPRPVGTTARANLRPWYLPCEPGPSAISADSALVGGIQVRAASVVGPGHRCEEPATPRQDAYRLAVDSSGDHLIVAVADGMADSSHSHLGANVAVNALVQHLRAVTPGPVHPHPQELFLSAAQQMIAAAEQRGLQPEAVRVAALAAIVEIAPNAEGIRQAWLASVADVSAWIRYEGGWRQVAGDAKRGMDGSRLKEFLPYHPRAVKSWSVGLGPDDVLALTTDGIGDVLGPGEIAAWFAGQWAAPPHISDFIDVVGFEAKGELDDRTAVVLWCSPSGRRP